MTEEWKAVPGFEGLYEASSCGRVRSLDRHMTRKDGKPLFIPGRMLKALPNNNGYPRLSLVRDGISHWRTVHSIIAATFLAPPPRDTGPQATDYGVNHKDGDKTNNHAHNLEYVTNAANLKHARATGLLSVVGTKNGRAKITENEVREIRRLYAAGARQVDLADAFGIDQTQVSRVVRGESWPHVHDHAISVQP